MVVLFSCPTLLFILIKESLSRCLVQTVTPALLPLPLWCEDCLSTSGKVWRNLMFQHSNVFNTVFCGMEEGYTDAQMCSKCYVCLVLLPCWVTSVHCGPSYLCCISIRIVFMFYFEWVSLKKSVGEESLLLHCIRMLVVKVKLHASLPWWLVISCSSWQVQITGSASLHSSLINMTPLLLMDFLEPPWHSSHTVRKWLINSASRTLLGFRKSFLSLYL